MGANSKNDQSQHKENQAAAKIAELVSRLRSTLGV